MSRSGDRWRRVADLFEQALLRPSDRRREWLRETCSDEPQIRSEVEEMLAAHERAGGILDHSVDSLVYEVLGSGTPEPAGGTVGPYRIEREIGRGGMGVVYRAHDPRLDRFVALKFLPAEVAADDEMRARFLAEAKAASALDHPNICTIYDIGRSAQGRYYIAMAHYEGETLDRRLERGPLTVNDCLEIVRQATHGLARAHEAGIVHRDIKPSNIMITSRGEVKILDFGVAKLQGDAALTQPGILVGTPAYMSPEQLEGESVDGRSDLWALGVVLYEMLTGRRPFRGDRAKVFAEILRGAPEPAVTINPEVPPWLSDVVDGLLVKSPSGRYASAAELLRDLTRESRDRSEWPAGDRRPLTPARLPETLTSFVGREEEIEGASELLAHVRLLTLTGPPGIGKTRLALRIAEHTSGRFPDGVAYVPLAPVGEAGLVASAIAEAIGLSEPPSGRMLSRLQEVLSDRIVLLVLDNFERVAAAAPAVGDLLAGCPGLKALVTSRVALRVSGEHEFPVPPLPVPRPDQIGGGREASAYPAIQLFRDRARAVDPSFTLGAGITRAVAELCARLDGLPLAIELAAARIKMFSPQELLSRLGARLELLKGGPRDRPARQQTLRGAIDWSYDLLSTEDQRLFRLLSVFVGGCTLQSAFDVCETECGADVDVLEGIASLVDHNLVRREEDRHGEARFVMFETIRAYGLDVLKRAGEIDAAQRAHAAHYLELAERAEPELTGADQAVWLDRLDAEHDNLRAVLGWAAHRGESEVALRLTAALWRFWLARGHLQEARARLEQALSLPKKASSLRARARALNGLGTVAHNQGENHYARDRLDESLALWRELEDERGIAVVVNSLAWVALELTDLEAARPLLREGLELNRRLGETRGIAVALNNLGWLAHYEGDSRAGRSYHGESLALRRRIGDQRGIVFALVNLAFAEQYGGEYESAVAHVDEALDVLRPLGDRLFEGFALLIRAQIWHDIGGRVEEAVQLARRSTPLWSESGNTSGVAWGRMATGEMLCDLGEYEEAKRLLEDALETWRSIGGRWGVARALRGLAGLAAIRGEHDEAGAQYRESLEICDGVGVRLGVAESLEGLAHLHTAAGQPGRAARLYAAAATLREELAAPLPPRMHPRRASDLTRIRTEPGSEEADRIWSEGLPGADLNLLVDEELTGA